MTDFDSKLRDYFSTLEVRIKKFIPNMVAETATEHFKQAFINKSWNDVPWTPYKNKLREPRRGSLMMRSNALFASIRPSLVSETKVVISAGNTRVAYAKIHNEGGLVSGVRKISSYNNNNFMGRGKTVKIKSHIRSVNYIIPKRQFMGKNELLLNEIKTRFKNTFKTF